MKEVKKHAYCIIAHDDTYCLNTLIGLLDDPRNDIFLLPDKKSKAGLIEGLDTKHAALKIISPQDRIDIRWGGLSMVKGELILFSEAIKSSTYEFIHLLSGADLPLKSQDEIHSFFDMSNPGTNFVRFSHGKAIEENVNFKTRFRHPFVEHQRIRKDGKLHHFLIDVGAKIIRKGSVGIQKFIGYRRDWGRLQIKKGSQWVSISFPFAKYLVENEKFILKKFRNVICPDEIFIHTMLYNSEFRDTIRDFDGERNEIIRKIDWQRGDPYIWRKEDFEELMESGALFARKFSSKVDKGIIDRISLSFKF